MLERKAFWLQPSFQFLIGLLQLTLFGCAVPFYCCFGHQMKLWVIVFLGHHNYIFRKFYMSVAGSSTETEIASISKSSFLEVESFSWFKTVGVWRIDHIYCNRRGVIYIIASMSITLWPPAPKQYQTNVFNISEQLSPTSILISVNIQWLPKVLSHPSFLYTLLQWTDFFLKWFLNGYSPGFLKVFQSVSLDTGCFLTHFNPVLYLYHCQIKNM